MPGIPALIIDTSLLEGGGRRVSAQVIHCSYCRASDVLRGHLVSFEFARKKFIHRGWEIHKKAACPKCVAKFKAANAAKTDRKVVPMPIKTNAPMAAIKSLADLSSVANVVVPPPVAREMSPGDRRKVFRAIDDAWDESRGRYAGSASDNQIAETLNVPRIWVETTRKEAFGDTGDSQDLQDFITQLTAAEKRGGRGDE